MKSKSWSLLIFFLVLLNSEAYSQCQLCYLSRPQADKALFNLKLKDELVLYSACERDDIARRIKIEKVEAIPTVDRKGYYEIKLTGTMIATFNIIDQRPVNYATMEVKISETIDLAYVHIRTGKFFDEKTGRIIYDATCLGIYLGFDCNPCIDPFDYPSGF